ncbi:MAG: ribosomal RNA small subunit methyltransferase A [candidate division Zixibacteria bacterium]|nr:ribosomal RNA small subunit methyltransferase A [candidate division Zixibacteria bacterium]
MVRRARKGQVFLVDNEVLRRIADAAAITAEETVLEIGMGRGELTQHLVRRAREVVAVELEERLVDGAARDFGPYENLTIVHADILDVPWDELVPGGRRVVVVGNVPFYITGPILELLSSHRRRIIRWSLLLQKEVAERVCAAPGGKAYGALSVKMQFWGEPYLAFEVPAEAFEPRPAVDAALVCYRYYDEADVLLKEPALFDPFVDFIFAARRKKVGNRVAALLGGRLSAADVAEVLRQAGFDPGARPERFSPRQFAALYRTFAPYLEV